MKKKFSPINNDGLLRAEAQYALYRNAKRAFDEKYPNGVDAEKVPILVLQRARMYIAEHFPGDSLEDHGEIDISATIAERLATLQYYQRPLMTDDDFIAQIREIIKPDVVALTTKQVARVFKIRALYEFIPPYNEKGEYTQFNSAAVRMRYSTARERVYGRKEERKETDFLALEAEDVESIFHAGAGNTLWFPVPLVMAQQLRRNWSPPPHFDFGDPSVVSPEKVVA